MTSLLRDILDPGVEQIWEASWDRANRNGWRWHQNGTITNLIAAKRMIIDLQEVHQINNVTIGAPFDKNYLRPKNDRSGASFGVYVRDVDELVVALRENFDVDPMKWKTIK